MGFSFHPISFFALLGLPFVGCILHFYLGFPEWISAIALVCGVYPFIHKSRERDSSNTPKYQEQVSASGLVLVSMCVTDMEPETNDVCTQKRSNQHSTKPYKQKIHVSASPAKTMKQKLLALRKLQQVQSRERCGKKTSASLEVPSNLASQSSSSEGSESNSLPIDVTLSKSEVTSMGAEIANQSSFAVSEPTKPMPENSPELMPSLTSNSFLCQPNRPLTAARNSEFRNQSPSTIPESTITMAERVTESNDMLSKDGDQKVTFSTTHYAKPNDAGIYSPKQGARSAPAFGPKSAVSSFGMQAVGPVESQCLINATPSSASRQRERTPFRPKNKAISFLTPFSKQIGLGSSMMESGTLTDLSFVTPSKTSCNSVQVLGKRKGTPFRPQSATPSKRSSVFSTVIKMEEQRSLIPDRVDAEDAYPSVMATAKSFEKRDSGVTKASNTASATKALSDIVGNSSKISSQSLVFDEENMRPSVAAAIKTIQARPKKLKEGIDESTQQESVIAAVKSLEKSKAEKSSTGVIVAAKTWDRNSDKFRLLRTMPYERPKSSVADAIKSFDTNSENTNPNTSLVANAVQGYAFKQKGQKLSAKVSELASEFHKNNPSLGRHNKGSAKSCEKRSGLATR